MEQRVQVAREKEWEKQVLLEKEKVEVEERLAELQRYTPSHNSSSLSLPLQSELLSKGHFVIVSIWDPGKCPLWGEVSLFCFVLFVVVVCLFVFVFVLGGWYQRFHCYIMYVVLLFLEFKPAQLRSLKSKLISWRLHWPSCRQKRLGLLGIKYEKHGIMSAASSSSFVPLFSLSPLFPPPLSLTSPLLLFLPPSLPPHSLSLTSLSPLPPLSSLSLLPHSKGSS